MNNIKVGFFSLSRRAADGDDRGYLEWHQLDHMPEQYQLPGLLLGQRWASTPACEKARAVSVDEWAETAHVVCYLMGNPVEETLEEFYTLGRLLAEKGRMARSLPSQYLAGLRLLEAAIQRPTFSPGRYRITTCYLDDDPATVGQRLEPVLAGIWEKSPVRPLLAAPFESMMHWDWDRFGPALP